MRHYCTKYGVITLYLAHQMRAIPARGSRTATPGRRLSQKTFQGDWSTWYSLIQGISVLGAGEDGLAVGVSERDEQYIRNRPVWVVILPRSSGL